MHPAAPTVSGSALPGLVLRCPHCVGLFRESVLLADVTLRTFGGGAVASLSVAGSLYALCHAKSRGHNAPNGRAYNGYY